MVSLNDLRSAPVALDWHEAVAAGAALATLLVESQALACPPLADVTLLPSGDLRVTGPGHIEGSAAAGVARVLAQLLESAPFPAELQQLVEDQAGDRRTGTDGIQAVTDFASQLAFFERPGRREVLAALAQRAELALDRARRSAALDALTERTRLAAGGAAVPVVAAPAVEGPGSTVQLDAAPVQRGWDPQEPGGIGRLIVPAVVGLVAFMAVAYVAAAWLERPAPSPTRAEVVDDELPMSGRASAGVKPGPVPALRPSPHPPASLPLSVPAAPRASGPAPVPAKVPGPIPAQPPPGPAPASTPAARTVDVVVAERDGRVVPSRIAPTSPVPTHASPAGRVFQSGDPQVTPAILIRPHLPESPPPDVPEEQVGTLEFVVAESGAVEHVHLISPANRYQERMLVAAAKTWQFQPATRDGRPVRYRTRIRVTL
ncbi:MAG: hypothetical protein ABIT71_21975 [Vicinamibacteraceae bacterium]